jgi:2-keto-4-pentenoate hydratase/2-oxohepta-3-ene-1,7-dioic acid hydratase in catechol pathway
MLAVLAAGPEALPILGKLADHGRLVDEISIHFCAPVDRPGKIVCIGLNYLPHIAEGKFERPAYPTVFPRYATSLVGHLQPIIRPLCSTQLDFEGEMVVIVGKTGRHIPQERALEWVAGYSIFNEASVRDYQFKTSQWAIGKNFDATGGFGPELVTGDELPPGGKGLRLTTRLNDQVVQSSSTDNMIFDVPALLTALSGVMTLEPGDLIVSGTPEGVGVFRKPPVFMKHGDSVEVAIEGIGVLRNPIVDESA